MYDRKGYTYTVDELILESIDNYIEKRWEPGGFVCACLANDAQRVLSAAHACYTRHHIQEVLWYINMNVPSALTGSYRAIEQHLGSKDE